MFRSDIGLSVPALRSCSRTSWLICICLGLAVILAVPASAQAQARVYVLGHGSGSTSGTPQYLTVVDGVTNRKGARIQLGLSGGLYGSMALAPDGQRVYVVNDWDGTVSVVSTATNTVVQTLPRTMFLGPSVLQSNVIHLTVSPDSQRIYVVDPIGLSVIDAASLTRLDYRFGNYHRLVVSTDGTRLYSEDAGSVPDRVLVRDSASLVTLADVGLPAPDAAAAHLSVTPDGRYVHLTRPRTGTGSGLAVLDTTTNTIVHERPIPNAYARASETSPNGAYLYVVGNRPLDQLYRLSPTTHLELSTTSGVGNSHDLAFSADSARAYVAMSTGVYVIDTATHSVLTTIPFSLSTDGSPRAVEVLGANPIGATPSNFRVTALSGNRVSLAWNQPASGPAPGYVIQGGLTPGSVLGSVPTGSSATNFTFDFPTGAFYIRVHAITSSGMSAASNEILILVNMPRVPSAPVNLLGLANGSAIELSWQNTTDGGAATGLVLDVSGAFTTSIALPLGEAFTFAGVPAGTYRLAIRAVNPVGTSAASAPITLTFPSACPGPPQMPRNVVVQRAGSLLSISWDPPVAGPAATSYIINVTGALNLALPLSARHAAGNVPSGTYNLSVVAVNACGSGIGTVAQSITIPPSSD
jgi:YVTN family beta-propeller protein